MGVNGMIPSAERPHEKTCGRSVMTGEGQSNKKSFFQRGSKKHACVLVVTHSVWRPKRDYRSDVPAIEDPRNRRESFIVFDPQTDCRGI